MGQTRQLFNSRRAFSMVEVIVAAVIFAAAAAGIFSTISVSTRFSPGTDARVRSALCAKKVLDGLNRQLGAATWNTLFSLGVHAVAADADCPASTYTVTDPGDGTRQVTVTVTY